MSREAFHNDPVEKIKTEETPDTKEVLEFFTEKNRPTKEREEADLAKKQADQEREIEREAEERKKLQELRDRINEKKAPRDVPPYKKEGQAYMPGADAELAQEDTNGDQGQEKEASFPEEEESVPSEKEEEQPEAQEEKGDEMTAEENPKEGESEKDADPEDKGNNAEKDEESDPEKKGEKKEIEEDPSAKKKEGPENEKSGPQQAEKNDYGYVFRKAAENKKEPIVGEPEEDKDKTREADPKKEGEANSGKPKNDPEDPAAKKKEKKAANPLPESEKAAGRMGAEVEALYGVSNRRKEEDLSEEENAVLRKYSLKRKNIEKIHDRATKLEIQKDIAHGSALTYKSIEKSKQAMAEGDVDELIKAAMLSKLSVETLVAAVGVRNEKAHLGKEQMGALGRMVKGYSGQYDRQWNERNNTPQEGRNVREIRSGKAKVLWDAAINGKDKDKDAALEILLKNSGRHDYYEQLKKSGNYRMYAQTHDGKVIYDIMWSDASGQDKRLKYVVDYSAGGKQAFNPNSFLGDMKLWKKYRVGLTTTEATSNPQAEKEKKQESQKKYPKNAAFIAYYRKVYNGDPDALREADELEQCLINGKKIKGQATIEEYIARLEEGLKAADIDSEEEKKALEKILGMAKDAIEEIKKDKDAQAPDAKQEDKSKHPDALAMKDLAPGDTAIVKKNMNGKEMVFRYRKDEDGNILLGRQNEDGSMQGKESPVDVNFRLEKGKNGVIDIEIRSMDGGDKQEQEPSDKKKEEENWKKRKEDLVKKYPRLKDFTEFSLQTGRSGRYSLIPGEFYKKLNENEKDSLETYLIARDYTLEIREDMTLFDNADIEAKYLAHITAGEWEKGSRSSEDLKDMKKLIGELLDGTYIGDFDYLKERAEKKESVKKEPDKAMQEKLIEMLERKRYALVLREVEGASIPSEVLESDKVQTLAKEGILEAIESGNMKRVSRLMKGFHVSNSFLAEEEVRQKGAQAIELMIINDKFEDAAATKEMLGMPEEYFQSKEMKELIEKKIAERIPVAGPQEKERIEKLLGVKKNTSEDNEENKHHYELYLWPGEERKYSIDAEVLDRIKPLLSEVPSAKDEEAVKEILYALLGKSKKEIANLDRITSVNKSKRDKDKIEVSFRAFEQSGIYEMPIYVIDFSNINLEKDNGHEITIRRK